MRRFGRRLPALRPEPDTSVEIRSAAPGQGEIWATVEGIALSPTPVVTYTSDEVTARCPVTKQPDMYVVTIELEDTKAAIESKSLKLYFESRRDLYIMCEAFANVIADDVDKALSAPPNGYPIKITVSVTQKSRGGITITAEAHRNG